MLHSTAPEPRFSGVDQHIQSRYIEAGLLAGAQIVIQHPVCDISGAPRLEVCGVAQARPMRIIDLLTHCSGLTAGSSAARKSMPCIAIP